MSRENDRSQQFWKEPPKETSYEAHLRRKRLKQQQRSRLPKSQVAGLGQSQETPDESDSRSRQSPRQPEGYSRDTHATEPPSTPSRPRTCLPEDYSRESSETEPPRRAGTRPPTLPNTTPAPSEAMPYETESDLPWEPPRQRTRSTGDMGNRTPLVRDRRVPGKSTRHLPEARRRKAWPWLLAGCAGGILTIALIVAIILVIFFRTTLGGTLFGGIFNQTFTQNNPPQEFPISNFAEIKVDNNLGNARANVTIAVDQSATVTTLTTVKRVQAANINDANKEFSRIPLIVNQGQPVNSAMPTLFLSVCGQSSTACGNTNDSVDITITLPPSKNADGSYFIDVETRSGNVSLQLAQQTQLAVGSCLSTGSGNVTFKGTFDTPPKGNDLIPCSQEMTKNPHPWYTFHSEVGNLDVTQIPVTKNVLLDASVTSGKINSDGFNLKTEMINRSLAYNGPLILNEPQLSAELKVDVGTGDINLHRI